MVGWPASATGRARPSPRCGRGCRARSACRRSPCPGRSPSIVVDTEPSPSRGDRHVAEAHAVLLAVRRAQLHLDRDEGRHAHHARSDAAVVRGEERERPRRLLVAGAARLVLRRFGGHALGARRLLLRLGRAWPRSRWSAVCAGAVVVGVGRRLLVVAAAAGNRQRKRRLPVRWPRFVVNFRREMPIRGSAGSHNAETMDTR